MPGKFRPHLGAVTAEAVSHHSEDLQVFHPCQEISLGHPVAFIQKRDPANAYETAQHMLLSAHCTCICMFAERAHYAFVVCAACGPRWTCVCGKTEKIWHVFCDITTVRIFWFCGTGDVPSVVRLLSAFVCSWTSGVSLWDWGGLRLRQSRDRAQVAPSGQKQYCAPADISSRPYFFFLSSFFPFGFLFHTCKVETETCVHSVLWQWWSWAPYWVMR